MVKKSWYPAVESAELTEAVAKAKVAKLKEGKSVKYYEDVIKGFNAFGRLVRERLWGQKQVGNEETPVTAQGAYEFMNCNRDATPSMIRKLQSGLQWKLARYPREDVTETVPLLWMQQGIQEI